MAGDHKTASIISISWIAFWLGTTRRPASSASAGSRFGGRPPDGQHHQHQLGRVLAGDHQAASIISISWIAFWSGTTTPPASSASAGSRFGWGPQDGQHHQHQLGRVLAGDHKTASIISISWVASWLATTRRPASSASAGSRFGWGPQDGQHHRSRFGWGPPDGQHHQHQLGRVLVGDHHTASIISISWIAFWLGTTRRPASSASAGSRFGWGPPGGQHHQHQLDRVLVGDHHTANMISISWIAFCLGTTSIISISWVASWLATTRRPASSASAGSRVGGRPPESQHHQHQLGRILAGDHQTSASVGSRFGWAPQDGQHHQRQPGRVLAGDHQTASIISISWIALWLGTTRRPASSASAGSRFGWGPPDGQHHQHQLGRVLAGHKTASIISISWIAFWLGTTTPPASSASAGSRFGWGPPDGQHHQHQPGRVLAGDHQTASIISISWIAFWLGTTRRPASSASAGSRFGWGPPGGQHHQHQLDRVLVGDHHTASIISISWVAFWLGTTRRPASSASAGSRLGWGPQDGQHHQHQLGRVLAGDHQTASIISISWVAIWLGTTRRPASSASAGSRFGWGPPDGQHHQHQLDRVLAGDHQTASIISISWIAFWRATTREQESSASAGSHFGWRPPDISISWIAFWLATTRRPASSASAGSRFGWGPPDGQHHQHQLDRVLVGDHHTASIISISWIAFWLGTTSSQHHQHQLDRVLAGDHQTASIISISWIAFWLGTTTPPTSSASVGSRFGWGPPDGQHHQQKS